MAYCTNTEVKALQGITGTGDDVLITTLIAQAQAAIDKRCDQSFEAAADTMRYFDAVEDTDGAWLFLDAPLCAITSIVTNADATVPTTLAATDYVTEPRNTTPWHAIKLLSSSDESWEYTDDPENGIEITGRWAYSTTAPNDIKRACIRLASYYYTQKDSPVFDVQVIPDAGVVTVPKGMPKDVEIMLEPYRRRF